MGRSAKARPKALTLDEVLGVIIIIVFFFKLMVQVRWKQKQAILEGAADSAFAVRKRFFLFFSISCQ